MRLMGIPELERLASLGPDGMAGTVAAFLAELAAADWRSEAEIVAQYPCAACTRGTVVIPLGEAHCVELLVKFEAGIVLVVFAGENAARRRFG